MARVRHIEYRNRYGGNGVALYGGRGGRGAETICATLLCSLLLLNCFVPSALFSDVLFRLRRGQPPSATSSAALYDGFSSLRAVQPLFHHSARSALSYNPQATSSSLFCTYCSVQQPLRRNKRKQVGSGQGHVGTSTNLSKRAKGVAAKNKGKSVGVVEEAEASEDSSSEEDELVPNADFIHSDGEEAEGFLNEQNYHVEINYADIDDEEED
ncbi:hypothetical protein SESBI_30392 [Sesbania bispinosa]|nr:hypothetical protein SESBI_30392 [Sesbania bispinosa]